MSVNRVKLQSVIAYIAGKTQPGKLKLFKLMYLVDFLAHARRGRCITGEMYENWAMGPVPGTVARDFDRTIRDCVDVARVPMGDSLLDEQRISRKAGFAVSLDSDELAILDEVIAAHGSKSGNQLKEYTHRTIPYLATPKPGDTIPYGLASYIGYEKPDRQYVESLVADPDIAAELRLALARMGAYA